MPGPSKNRIWPTRKVAENSTIQDVLEVLMFDLCLAENGREFHTDRYELMSDLRPSDEPSQLVVRRGAPFNVKLQCSRSYDPSVDTMVLILSLDPYGSEDITFGNGTEVNMVVEMVTITGSTKEEDGTVTLTLAITSPAQASVGKYNLEVHCRLDTKDTKSFFKFPLPLYLLFNPWCEHDDVYLKDEAARQEYVLNDSTMVWRQSATESGMTSWNLGQYEQDILDCSLFVIAVPGRVLPTFRGNPVRVVRALSGALNINNGPGVLEGRWNGDYADGVSPPAWSGSVKILQQFYRENMQPVKYGQCWVFAGIFATVCRAVGIPIRIVTNFNSAHDTEASLTLDFFVDANGETDGSMSSDSIWNYHVWNEAWMTRPDLGGGLYDGWQVVDATPQELSDGMFKLGPASVQAIKNGEVNLAYDTEFVFAEVNADRTYWVTRGDTCVPTLLEISKDYIGQDISTKVVGKNEREDVTTAYKHREGTPEERQVMASALKLGSQRFTSNAVVKKLLVPQDENARANASSEWVKLELKTYQEHRLGESFDIELSITNTLAGQTVQVVGTLWLKHTDYTSKHSEDIRKIAIDQTIQPVSSVPIKVSIPFAEYNNPAFDQSHIKALCVVEVPGTNQTYFTHEIFNLATPDITMNLVQDPSSIGGYMVQGSFKNPLPIPLSGGRFLIEGSRLTKPSEQTVSNRHYILIASTRFLRTFSLFNSPSAEVLNVKSVDLCIEQNGKDHHTQRYDLMSRDEYSGKIPKLVVRRGEPFRLRLLCDRPYDRSRDALSLIFSVADEDQPTHGHGTLVGIAVNQFPNQLGEPLEWGAAIEEIRGDLLQILVKPAATAPVGQWKLDIDTKLLSDAFGRSYSLPQAFYVLFNPWCPDDQVYLEEKAHRHEYIMADTTLIYRGSYNRLRPSVWKFGQFEKHILDCSLLLIAKIGKVSATHRGDPVRVCRAISAAVNSPDDDGALLGNWGTDYSGGTAPTKWVGSVEILQQFYKKQKPVKYAQCWVFAGVVSTIARAIGIPSRVVTNYSSAHDTQASLTVDYFVDKAGKIMEEMNADSIWNYHVWNEVWMQRPDLGIGSDGDYGGWQAIDATPQETSDGMYRCGPASVLAVKLGEVLKPYDNNFLFAEVNADKVFWRYTGPSHPLKLLRKDVLGIGLFISTKAVGRWEREDITANYKFAEKSVEERATMLKALKQANSYFSRYYLNEEFNEVYFNFELRDDIKIGEPFSVILLIKNRSSENRHTVEGSLHVDTVLYTGKSRDSVKVETFSVALEPGTEESVRMMVDFHEYYGKLRDQAAFNISCMATVQDTEFEFYAQDDFRVRKPDIKISLMGTPVSQAPVEVQFTLENPLPIPLRKGLFHVEGSGIGKPLLFKHPEIAPGEKVLNTFTMIPPYSGRLTIAAKFTSKELDDVDGFLAFLANPRPEDIIMETEDNEIIARTDVID
ncbi:hypothetical protein ZHAS_00002672 [Anopheles sinensis]|uniref:protein-glutamine gamma-glutamyltransferase n=1 Tax=Anopheles sinensis TaxID=74873 RepID=A0A084VCS4_ANOSI|nr:hypothetical protein ZHAS_00002672 [Anopheles sinensis]